MSVRRIRHPTNPNINLIVKDDDVQEAVFKAPKRKLIGNDGSEDESESEVSPSGTPKKFLPKKTIVPPPPKKKQEEEEIVIVQPESQVVLNDYSEIIQWENELSFIAKMAMQPLYQFIGMVDVKMGGGGDLRKFYRWIDNNSSLEARMDSVNRGAKSKEEFVTRNLHFGPQVLSWFMKIKEKQAQTPENIGMCFDHDAGGFADFGRQGVNIELQRLLEHIDRALVPSWIFSVAGAHLMSFILNQASYGALILARNKICRNDALHDVSLQALVCSSAVNDKFATIAAQEQLVASGGNAYNSYRLGGQQRGGGMSFNISAGFRTRTALAKNMLGAQDGWNDVYKTTNPEITQLDALLREYNQLKLRYGLQEWGIRDNSEPAEVDRIVGVDGFDGAVRARFKELQAIKKTGIATRDLMPYILKHADFL